MKKTSRRQLQGPVTPLRPATLFAGSGVIVQLATVLWVSFFELSYDAALLWILMGLALMVVGLVLWLQARQED